MNSRGAAGTAGASGVTGVAGVTGAAPSDGEGVMLAGALVGVFVFAGVCALALVGATAAGSPVKGGVCGALTSSVFISFIAVHPAAIKIRTTAMMAMMRLFRDGAGAGATGVLAVSG